MTVHKFVDRIEALRNDLRTKPDLYATATIPLTSEELHTLILSRDMNGRYLFPVTEEGRGARRCPGGLRFSPVDDDRWIVTVSRGLRGIDYI